MSTSLSVRFCRNTIMMVGIPVPKKIFAGKPMMAAILSFSMRLRRMLPSSPPRKSTPWGNTMHIMPEGFRWYKSCSRKA